MGKKSKAKAAAARRRLVATGINCLFGNASARVPGEATGFGQQVYIAASSDCAAAETLLTRTELDWVCKVRDAAVELQATCTTVELFQIATVTKGDPEKIRSRMSKLQALKDKYALPMSFKAANDMTNTPVFMAPTGRLVDNGSAGFTLNYAEWHPSRLTAEMVPMVLGMACAMFEGFCSSLADIRTGSFIMANFKGVGPSNISVSMDSKFFKLINGSYPVRVARIVIVDANLVASAAIRILKATGMITKKLGDRMITVHSNDLAKHFDIKELPQFLGDGENSEGAVAVHTRNAATRRKLDAALCKSYGYKFELTPSDMTQWIEVTERPATPRPPAVGEEESSADDDAATSKGTTS